MPNIRIAAVGYLIGVIFVSFSRLVNIVPDVDRVLITIGTIGSGLFFASAAVAFFGDRTKA